MQWIKLALACMLVLPLMGQGVIPIRRATAAGGQSKANVTFWWRFDTTTLDGTDDHSAGDTTADVSGDAVIPSAAAAKVGSNGGLFDDTSSNRGDGVNFDVSSRDIVDEGAGACSGWIRYDDWEGHMKFFMLNSAQDLYFRTMATQGYCGFNVGGTDYPDGTGISGCMPDTSTWYHVWIRWDTNNGAGADELEIKIDDSSVYSASNLTLSPNAPSTFYLVWNGSSAQAFADYELDHVICTDETGENDDHYDWRATDSYDDAPA